MAGALTEDESIARAKIVDQRLRDEGETGPVYVLMGAEMILFVTEWTHGSYKGFTLQERYAGMHRYRDSDEVEEEMGRLLEQPTSSDIARMLVNGELLMVAQLSPDEQSIEPLAEPVPA